MVDPTERPPHGETIAILGGAGMMGVAAAKELIRLGAKVVLLGRTEASLKRAKDLLDDEADCCLADAGDRSSLSAALSSIAPVDHVVVAVSASASASSVSETLPEDAKAAFDRFWACYNAVHLAPLHLPSNGSVTLISGSSARSPAPGYGVWTTLHGAIEALVRSPHIDIAPIRVNAVSPGGSASHPTGSL